MQRLAIIGGTGLTPISDLHITNMQTVETPYGSTSAAFSHGELAGKEIVFLARHGNNHTIPPHKINYRANIWALQSMGITHVIAGAAVGGIHPNIPPKKIVIPDQIIDYTYSRKQTFLEDDLEHVTHADFTHPYCSDMRTIMLQAAKDLRFDVFDGGTYGATQGPRLETAAEVNRLEKDGCDIIGMTGMPEATLAKELGLCYAVCAMSVNWAAGRGESEITMVEIDQAIEKGMGSVKQLIAASIKLFSK